MNKILTIIKNLLLLLNLILMIIFIKVIPYTEPGMVIYQSVLVFTFIISIKDIIQKNEINKKYNILFIISELIVIFIYIRAFCDQGFIYNSSKYMKGITETSSLIDEYRYVILNYLNQNSIYLITMLVLLYIYRRCNIKFHSIHLKERILKNYSVISIICMLISICTIIPTFECFADEFPKLPYLIFTIILLGIEIFELIRNNHKKREWIIYVGFLFNMLAIISIII